MDVARARFAITALIAVTGLTACGASNGSGSNVFNETSAKCAATAVANQYVVHWKDGTSSVYKNTTRAALDAQIIKPNLDQIEFAEQDQKVHTPKQPLVVEAQAAVPDTGWGQEIVQANQAWSQGYNGSGVLVAVVDSGVDRTHPQLKNQIWVNPGESGTDAQGRDKSSNGVDDDGNGYIDDVSGYDFSTNTANVTDSTGHGTHVAGIISAQHSAGSIQGVAEGVKILPLRFIGSNDSGNISDAIRAMYYAASMGAKVINASWGGAPCSQDLQRAISALGAQGVIFVSAAGNDDANLDTDPEFPAAFGMDTQITVAASTASDTQSLYSNYSFNLSHLTAPGDSIISTYPGGGTRSMSGTSMATPFVTAAVAILRGARPKATISDIKNALLDTVDSGPFEVASRGRLNIAKALQQILALPE